MTEQLQLDIGGAVRGDLAIAAAQNGLQHSETLPGCPNRSENRSQPGSQPAGRRSARHAPNTPLASWAAAQRLSGPRPWRESSVNRGALDSPEHALPQTKCVCDRPLPERDELGVHCTKCGRRP